MPEGSALSGHGARGGAPSGGDGLGATSVISAGTLIKGELFAEGTLRIEGQVEGTVRCQDTVIVQESGKVKANIEAKQVIVSGTLHGNIVAQDRIEIKASAHVAGDLMAPRIGLAAGATYSGHVATEVTQEGRAHLIGSNKAAPAAAK